MESEIILRPGDGAKLKYLGSEITVKVAGKDSGGAFSVCEFAIPAGVDGPAPHIHYAHEETWYVLEGEPLLPLGGRDVVAPAGSVVFVPRGLVHTYSNPGPKPAKILGVFTPAGYERCYEEVARFFPSGAPSDPSTLIAIMKKYDTEPAGTAIILFADIADSTALTERMGDATFRAKARELDAALRPIIRECAGAPVEGRLVGDGLMAVFASAQAAIEAALRCSEAAIHSGLPLHLGLHAGDVIREGNNVYGGAVNIAARVAATCRAGEVLVSDTVRGLARTSATASFEDRGEHMLKGVADPQRLWAVREKVEHV